MFDRETNGRIAKAEISLFDAIHAEILEHRMAEKAKYRRVRKDARKYKELPEQRRQREIMRKDRMYGFVSCENCPKVVGRPDSLPIRTRSITEAEKVVRADWELEQDSMAEDSLWNEYNAEIRRERLQNLYEWLKYA